MTLEIKEELHKLDIRFSILITIIGCLVLGTAIVVSMMFGPTVFTIPFYSEEKVTSIPIIDLGNVNGFVMSSDGLPVGGVSVHIYKHMGLIDSADKKAGYTISEITKSDGSYSFNDLPSGVYKFTVTYPDGTIQTIDNYAVWPSSSSSYVFVA